MPKNKSHPTDYRTRHRARNHADAHAHEPTATVESANRHPLVPAGPAKLIAQAADLRELIAHLRQAGCFAYDSEFIGELTYVPKLCLVQVASTTKVALIDPLGELDLTPFWELIADASVIKIVHAGEQDIEPVARHLGKEAANVFDTQIAAGFVGMTYPVSLSRLAQELLDVKLGKGLTFTAWDQRPLSKSQLRYAADDVRYLPALHALLGERLAENGHQSWVTEECAALCDEARYRFDPDVQIHRVRGSGSLHGSAPAILRELVIWRDVAAREENVPARALVKDEVLVDLARSPARDIQQLDRVRGLPRPVKSARGEALVAATARGLALAGTQAPAPRHPEESPAERFRADAFWADAQALCAGQQIDPAVVSSRQEAGEFYRLVRDGGDALAHPLMRGWRRTAVGQPLLDLLAGRNGIALVWSNQRPRAKIVAG